MGHPNVHPTQNMCSTCPAGKFMLPFCIRECPFKCMHGGVCDAASGQCRCPVGTRGEVCEEFCPADTFGRYCQFTCGISGCVKIQFCKNEPVGCHGHVVFSTLFLAMEIIINCFFTIDR